MNDTEGFTIDMFSGYITQQKFFLSDLTRIRIFDPAHVRYGSKMCVLLIIKMEYEPYFSYLIKHVLFYLAIRICDPVQQKVHLVYF